MGISDARSAWATECRHGLVVLRPSPLSMTSASASASGNAPASESRSGALPSDFDAAIGERRFCKRRRETERRCPDNETPESRRDAAPCGPAARLAQLDGYAARARVVSAKKFERGEAVDRCRVKRETNPREGGRVCHPHRPGCRPGNSEACAAGSARLDFEDDESNAFPPRCPTGGLARDTA